MSTAHVRWFRDSDHYILCSRQRRHCPQQPGVRDQSRPHQEQVTRCQRRRRVPDPRSRN